MMTRAARMPVEQLRRTNRFMWQLERDLHRSDREGMMHYERQLVNWMAMHPLVGNGAVLAASVCFK